MWKVLILGDFNLRKTPLVYGILGQPSYICNTKNLSYLSEYFLRQQLIFLTNLWSGLQHQVYDANNDKYSFNIV